jgi:glycosyltransferase involved in cell wall biosynthesis
MSALKVALLSPFIHPIVEPFVGGTEAFLARFALTLCHRGVDVVCYACEGSYIPGIEIRTCGVAMGSLAYPRASHEMTGDEILAIRAYEDGVMYEAIENACNDASIDLLHNHSFSAIPLFLSHRLRFPVLHTLHLPPMLPNMREALRFCQDNAIALNLVAVSQAQAQLWQTYYLANHIIYNGLDVESLPRGTSHNGSLAFVGRIDADKGVEDAIAVAALLGQHLDIYGAPQPYNTTYFETCILPLLRIHQNVTYHGLVMQEALFAGLRQAQALLFPVKWDEPFGNVIIEAMAVGTPVVMYERGSARELIIDGMSGYIVDCDNISLMAAAVEKTVTFDRAACAEYARTHFSLTKCADSYLEIMQTLCTSSPKQALAY